MILNILYAVSSVFFVIGVVTVISIILLKFLKPDKKDKIFVVSVFGEESKGADVNISLIVSVLSLLGIYGRTKIIAADNGMNDSEKIKLISAFGRDERIIFTSAGDINRIFSEK